jgi:hypothetical protein
VPSHTIDTKPAAATPDATSVDQIRLDVVNTIDGSARSSSSGVSASGGLILGGAGGRGGAGVAAAPAVVPLALPLPLVVLMPLLLPLRCAAADARAASVVPSRFSIFDGC